MFAVLSFIDLGAVSIVAGVVVAALWKTNRSLKIQVGNVQASVDTAAEVAALAARKVDQATEIVQQVNQAVNCRPDSDPTLYEQVRRISLKVDDLAAVSHRTEAKTESIGAKLTAHLAHHQADSDRDIAARQGEIDRRA